MKKIVVLFIGFFLIYELFCQQEPQVKFDHKSVDSWLENAKDRNPKIVSNTPLVSYQDFAKLLETYIHNQKGFLMSSQWLGEKINSEDPHLKNDFRDEIDQPFALKVTIPSGGVGYFWGDLHGDVQALAICLKVLKDNEVINDAFEVIKPDTYFFFLGDMVDRGEHQFDLLCLILTLAIKNQGKVFLIRGNHEDLGYSDKYGFEDQLKNLYKQQYPDKTLYIKDSIFQSIALFYNLMPDVAFVGCNNNYLQCCHGGIEIRYNPKELLAQPEKLQYQLIKKTEENNTLLRELMQDAAKVKNFNIDETAYTFFSNNFKDSGNPFFKFNFGFMWGDFNNDFVKNYNTYYNPRRGLFAGKDFTQEILKYYSSDTVRVRGIMRAHQHNDTLPGILAPANGGVYPMWNNNIITNLSTSQFNGVIAFNKITFFDQYSEWRLTNFSGQTINDIKEKENSLEAWVNNKVYIKEETPEKTITGLNLELLAKVDNEIEKKRPDYERIKKWLSAIKKDPLNPENHEYERAQRELKIFEKFMTTLNSFNEGNYFDAEIGFRDLLEEELIKFKAREYYARTVINAGMEGKYDYALSKLYNTLIDTSAMQPDLQKANYLIRNLKVLTAIT